MLKIGLCQCENAVGQVRSYEFLCPRVPIAFTEKETLKEIASEVKIGRVTRLNTRNPDNPQLISVAWIRPSRTHCAWLHPRTRGVLDNALNVGA